VTATDRQLIFEAGGARLTVDPAQGGRMTSFVVGAEERLVTEGYGPIRWGSYPMAPWAGRIRDGRFQFQGRTVHLPLNLPPHAIHGTVFERPWDVVDESSIAIDLGPSWPFAGRVTQRFALAEDHLRVELELEADEPMPAIVGWHPWFRRPVSLAVEPGRMLERGSNGLPTGALVAPTPPPWDDCFIELPSAPRLTWPDGLSLEITSSADHWVVYDESPDGVCVEPQTGPPDGLTAAPTVGPGAPLEAWMTWAWEAGAD